MPSELAEPWRAFLAALDSKAEASVDLHCIGGFAVTLYYGLERPTGDIDVWAVVPNEKKAWLHSIAGKGSDLHRTHHVYVQIVSVTALPEGYVDRLTELFPGVFDRLRLFVPDPYDLALSKLERNSDVDMDDIKHLARVCNFDVAVLRERYQKEFRAHLHGPQSRHDVTMHLWVEAITEERSSR